jgi:hypothetical protein
MQWDTITDQWLWICAAGAFVIFIGALAALRLNKPKSHDKTQSNVATQNGGRQLGESILLTLNQLATSFSRWRRLGSLILWAA